MTAAITRAIHTNGIRMAVSEQGEGPPVVLCHGFPEIAYSWRHQIPALATAGFHAITPDQRGYGATERPAAVTDYDIRHLTGDLVGLLDALGLQRAVFAGHDWGGIVVWHMALLHPARPAGVIGVNTPYFPRPSAPPLTLMRAMWGDNYYVVHFQKPGEADTALARDVRRVFTQLVRSGVPLAETRTPRHGRNLVEVVTGPEPPGRLLLSEDELQHLRTRLRADRLHGRDQLVPQPGPELGDDAPARRGEGRGPRAHDHRGARPRPAARAGRGDARPRARSRDGHDPGLRPLDAAGAARRALRHHDRLAHAPVPQRVSTAAAHPAGSSIWG